ncbi:hypothetical protein K502DRAFT_353311 [Neoconidiobolus thromboides FSU 785]|nr:hypothetical protein K502DRAFT_353311 [Neoconidiobolus thromboides FSU 785]
MEIDKPVIISFIIGILIYFLTGVSLLGLAIYYLTINDYIHPLIVTKDISAALLVLGLFILLTSLFGVVGAWRPIKYKNLVTLLGWSLLIAIIYELVLGLCIWMLTMTPQAHFTNKWRQWSVEERAIVQYKGKCCGLSNSTDNIVPMKQCHTNNGSSGCLIYLTKLSSSIYVDIYTTLFVFILLNFFVLLSSAILSQVRSDVERYEKAMEKSNGK